jgi:hypothetical protein
VPEILSSLSGQHLKAAVAHGDVDILVREIRRLAASINGKRMPLVDPQQSFSKDIALRKMIQEIEKAPAL